jgi:hypothetical protein
MAVVLNEDVTEVTEWVQLREIAVIFAARGVWGRDDTPKTGGEPRHRVACRSGIASI